MKTMQNITPPALVETVNDNVAETIISLQELIVRNASELKRLKFEKKLITEQEKSLLENDFKYREVQEIAEASKQAVKERRAVIKNTAQAVSLKAKKHEIIEEEKEVAETLSNYLMSYYSMTNSTIVETDAGDQIQIKLKASISPRQLELF